MTLLALLLFAAGPTAEVRPGMTVAQVRAALGAPGAVSRQVVAHRAIEQWHYGGDVGLRLTFDCRRGKPPVLETVTRVNR
jgi:hypothetical protein